MTCDHDATRGSFAAFFGATRLIGGQDLPGEGWVLLGNCVSCDSTLTIPIAEPRGSAVRGEIDAGAEERIIADIRRHGNGHHIDAPEFEAHARKLAYACPACGAPPTYSCSNGDRLANHCPGRGETIDQHADRILQRSDR